MDWAYIFTLCWIAFMGIVPPAVTSAILGYLMYKYGEKKGREWGQKQYEMAKEEIRQYVKTELLSDIGDSIRQTLNGIFGPMIKGGNAETKAAALEYMQKNPSMGGLIMNILMKGAAKYAVKEWGLPKETLDMVGGPLNLGSGFHLGKKQDDQLKPVEVPRP